MKKKTNKEWLLEVLNLVGKSYIPLEPYRGSKENITIYHADCGHTFKITPNAFLKGQRCSFCAKIRRAIKQTHSVQWFVKQLQQKYGNRYCVVGNYVDTKTPVKIRCTWCNTTWDPTPNNLLRGYGCPRCAGRIVTQEDFEKRVRSKNNGQFTFLDSYRGIDVKIRCRCNNCNYTWSLTPHDFYRIKGCPMCQTNHSYTTSEYRIKLFNIHGNEYSLVESYKPNRKLKFRHNKCNHEFLARSADMLEINTGCPYCNESHGESMIRHFLKLHNITYNQQYKFIGCKYKQELPFDFYLPKYRIAIEYDGIQHFQINHFGRTKSNFAIAKLRDHIKDWYCQSHNIQLVRIPYTAKTEKDIKSYLYML